jgi:Domain of unknown function (DUF4395)
VTNPLTPPARKVDPRGQRFGAGFSAVILVAAYLLDQPVIVLGVAIAMFASSAFGTQYWLLGKPWPYIRRALKLGPAEPEHEYPPRFAQALGVTFLGLGLILIALRITLGGWLLVGAVVALQTLLAATGYCLGCRLYFLRWWIPSVFASLIGRGSTLPRIHLRPTQD